MRVFAIRPDNILDPLAACEWVERWIEKHHTPRLLCLDDWTKVYRLAEAEIGEEEISILRSHAVSSKVPVDQFLRWLAVWYNLTREDDTSPIIFTDLGVFPKATPPRNVEYVTTRFSYVKPARIGQAILRMIGKSSQVWRKSAKIVNDMSFFDSTPICTLDQWVVMCDNPIPTRDQIHERLKG